MDVGSGKVSEYCLKSKTLKILTIQRIQNQMPCSLTTNILSNYIFPFKPLQLWHDSKRNLTK